MIDVVFLLFSMVFSIVLLGTQCGRGKTRKVPSVSAERKSRRSRESKMMHGVCKASPKVQAKQKKKKKGSNSGMDDALAPPAVDVDPAPTPETPQPVPMPSPGLQLAETQIEEPSERNKPVAEKKPNAGSRRKERTMKTALFKKKEPKKEEFWDDQNDDDTLACVKSIE